MSAAPNIIRTLSTPIQGQLPPQVLSRPKPPVYSGDPIYRSGDAIFSATGYLIVHGRAISVQEAETITETRLKTYKISRERLHGAQLFHGSSSASLLAFTQYCDSEGSLYPVGILEKKDRVPFSGEIIFGRGKVNAVALSSTWIGHIDVALSYANSGGWVPEIGKQRIGEEYTKNEIEINQLRMAHWHKLSDDEKWLVAGSFPVLYGIKSERKDSHLMVPHGLRGEIGLKGGALKDEIKVVFVPADKVKAVQSILGSNIPVEILSQTMKPPKPKDCGEGSPPTLSEPQFITPPVK